MSRQGQYPRIARVWSKFFVPPKCKVVMALECLGWSARIVNSNKVPRSNPGLVTFYVPYMNLYGEARSFILTSFRLFARNFRTAGQLEVWERWYSMAQPNCRYIRPFCWNIYHVRIVTSPASVDVLVTAFKTNRSCTQVRIYSPKNMEVLGDWWYDLSQGNEAFTNDPTGPREWKPCTIILSLALMIHRDETALEEYTWGMADSLQRDHI